MGETGKQPFHESRWRPAAHHMVGLRRHTGRRDEQEPERGGAQHPADVIFLLVHDVPFHRLKAVPAIQAQDTAGTQDRCTCPDFPGGIG